MESLTLRWFWLFGSSLSSNFQIKRMKRNILHYFVSRVFFIHTVLRWLFRCVLKTVNKIAFLSSDVLPFKQTLPFKQRIIFAFFHNIKKIILQNFLRPCSTQQIFPCRSYSALVHLVELLIATIPFVPIFSKIFTEIRFIFLTEIA